MELLPKYKFKKLESYGNSNPQAPTLLPQGKRTINDVYSGGGAMWSKGNSDNDKLNNVNLNHDKSSDDKLQLKKHKKLVRQARERVSDIEKYLRETPFKETEKKVMTDKQELMLLRFLTENFHKKLINEKLDFIVTGGYAIQTYSKNVYMTGDIDIKVYSSEIINNVSKLRDKVLKILRDQIKERDQLKEPSLVILDPIDLLYQQHNIKIDIIEQKKNDPNIPIKIMHDGEIICEIVFLIYPVRDHLIEIIEINKSNDDNSNDDKSNNDNSNDDNSNDGNSNDDKSNDGNSKDDKSKKKFQLKMYKPIVLIKNLLKATNNFIHRITNKQKGNSIYNEKISDWKKQFKLLLSLLFMKKTIKSSKLL